MNWDVIPIPWPSVSGKLGAFGRLQLFGAFIPGLIILTELWAALQPRAEVAAAGGLLQYASNQTSRIDDVVLALAVALFALSALAVGYLCRALAWPVVGKLGSLIKAAPVERRAELDRKYGSANVDQALARQPALAAALASGHDFGYSKLWLRTRAPALAVDHLETEINTLIALVTPLALAPIVGWRATEDVWWLGAVTALALLSIITIVWKTRKITELEREEGSRNVLFAEWFDASRPDDRVIAPN